MKKKILIVPGNTDLNRGDQALVWESVNIFKEIYPGVQVYLYESGANDLERNLQKNQSEKKGFSFIHRILPHPRRSSTGNQIRHSHLIFIKWAITGAFDLFKSILLLSRFSFLNYSGNFLLSKKQKQSLEIFSELDFLVVKGGGFIHSYGKIYDSYVMYYFLFDLLLAQKFKIKTIVLPNSIGPIKNRLAKNIVKRVLRKSSFISVREEVSKLFVQNELGLGSSVYPDLGFYLKSSDIQLENYLKENGINLKEKNMAITLRPYRFDGYDKPEELYENYINQFALFITIQINKGYVISLIAQTLGPSAHEDDRIALKEVYNRVKERSGNKIVYIENFSFSCADIQKLYSYYDIMIGTRFHSVIFALNENVPSIAIAYGGNKSFGIMNDMGLSNYVMHISEVNSEALNQMLTDLESGREQYLRQVFNYKKYLSSAKNNLINSVKQLETDFNHISSE